MKKVSFSNFIEFIIIVLIILITLTGGSIFNNLVEVNIFLLTTLLFVFINDHKGKLKKNGLIILSIGIGIYLLIDVVYMYHIVGTLGYISIFFCMIELMNCSIKVEFLSKIVKWIYIYCIVVGISIILGSINHSIILDTFSFMIPKDLIIQMEYEYSKGYISGIAVGKAFGAYIMNIGIATVISRISLEKKINIKTIIPLGIFIIALMLTGKRVLAIIPIVATIALLFVNIKSIKKSRIVTMILIGIILAFFIVRFVPSTQIVIKRFIEDADDLETFNNRDTMWYYSLKMFNNKPIIGYGINTYRTFLRNNGVVERLIMNGHNMYLQLLGETGIVGSILFFVLFIMALFKNYKLLKNELIIKNKRCYRLLNFSMYIQILFLIYGITGNNMHTYSQIFTYFFALTIVINCENKVKIENNMIKERKQYGANNCKVKK
ncbi:MAG: O-antigen ligase family protein [Clostridia bacterium]|nr:O-antigen ligase family protein [Clostridia bacterium]